MKKLLVVFLALGLMMQYTACTNNQAQEDSEFVENADVEKIEAEEAIQADANKTDTPLAENEPSSLATDKSLESALGESTASTETPTDNLTLEDAATTQTEAPSETPADNIATAPTLDENSLGDTPPPVIENNTTTTDSLALNDTTTPSETIPPLENNLNDSALNMTEAPPADTALVEPSAADAVAPAPTKKKKAKKSADQVAAFDSGATPVAETSSVKPMNANASKKKISEMVPYAFNDGFVNSIYIARPKETLKQISQTIFGADKTKELKQINTYLKARSPRAGDKIAYVSPNRPTDSSKTISFYEDTGMVAETYVATKNDNLKKVAKKLLGYDRAYEEVWATNTLETKGKMNEGETFKYWKSTSTITPSMPSLPLANNSANVITNPNELPKPNKNSDKNSDLAANQLPNDLPPPPPADLPPPPPENPQMAMNNQGGDLPPPPPPPTDDLAANAAGSMEAPPPPPADEAAAKPPKTKPAPADALTEEPTEEDQGSDLYTMLGIGVIVLGGVAIVMMRRKKKMSADISMGETGVGT